MSATKTKKNPTRYVGSILLLIAASRSLYEAVTGYITETLHDAIGADSTTYWVIALSNAKAQGMDTSAMIENEVPQTVRQQVKAAWAKTEAYLDDNSKYALLDQAAHPMAVLVNCLRVTADKATTEQKQAFGFASQEELQAIHTALQTATISENGFNAATLAAFFLGNPAADMQALGVFAGAQNFDQQTINAIASWFEERTAGTVGAFVAIGLSPDKIEGITLAAQAQAAIEANQAGGQRQQQPYAS